MIKTKNNLAMKVVAMVLAITMIIGTIPSGIATVFANESGAVAKIGDKEYASLEAALSDVPVGNSKETPAEATVIELCQDASHSFDVGISNGTKPKNIELRLNDNTLTLKPAVGSTGTISNGIRVLAYSKLTITNGNIVCSSEEDDNVKVGIANYGELILDGVNVQSGALTRYTVNNRGELTLKGDTIVQNGQVAPNDYSDSTGLVAITNDPYDLYYSTPMNATINCDSENVVVGNIQIERYEIAKNHEKGNNVLNISEGSFGSIVIPEEASDTGIDVVGNITSGRFEAASGVELHNVMDLTVAGVAYQTPEKAVSIKLTDDIENGFDVGISNGTAPKYFKLDLNERTITLRPAVGSTGTVSSGIRVLAYSKLEIKNGDVVCSDTVEDNIKVGIANYGTLILDSVNVQSGALTKYTINNRGELTLSGTTTVENAQVAQDDYSTGSTYVAITNDPYTLYYTNDAVINCDSEDVKVGNVQLETYSSAGNVKLNISEGSFGEVVAPTVSENDKVEILGNITGGKYTNDVSDYVASDYNVSFDNNAYTVAQKLEQENFGFETPVPLDQWVGKTYTNKVTGVQGTGTTTYSVVAGEDVATVNATTGEVTFLKLGTVTIQADNTGDSEYLGASAKYSVTSVKNQQTTAFVFDTTGPVEIDWALNETYQNIASGGDGEGAVSYEILANNGVATIDSETGVVTVIKAGEVTIQATKASDDEYFATTTTYILRINKVEQESLVVVAEDVITYNPDWQEAITVSGGSGNGKVKFELPNDYSEYAEINPNTGAIKTKRYGTIKVLVSKEGDDCYNATEAKEVVIEIKRAEQSDFKFAVETPNAITYGDNNNLFTNVASGGQTTNSPTYIISGDAATIDEATGELTIVKAGTVTVTATKLGDNCYETVAATYTLEIKHARQSFAFEEGQEVSETYGIHEFVNEIIDEVGTGALTFEIVSGDDIGATIDENTGVITFEDSELRVGEISVLATKAGNECYKAFELGYTLEISYLTVGNDVRPTLLGDTKNSSGWYTGDVTFTAPTGYQISMANTLDVSNVWDDSVTYDTEGVNDVNLYLMNAEGYITDAITSEDVKIDKKSPEKLEVKYSASIKDVILETITFGIFEAKTVDVTITVADTTSGIDTLTYDYGDGVVSVLAEDLAVDGTYKFTIDKDLRHKVEVEVSDIAGNTTVYDDDTTYVLDLTKPGFEVTYEYDSVSANIDNDIVYTQGKTTFKFKITEENYDLAKKEGVVPVVKYDDVPTSLEWTFDETTKVVTAYLPVSASGDHVVTVEYTDLSDNQMDTYSKEIHIDSTVPVIDVSYNNNEVRNDINYKADRTATVKITEHNFKADEVVLTVTAEDINGNPVDIASKGYADYAKNPANWNTVGDVHTLNTDGMKFDIEAIYSVKLEYTDLAENEAEAYETDFGVDKTAAGNIKIEYITSVLDEIIEGITFGFYKAPVTITVTAEDETAGVEYFEMTYTKEAGASDVNTDTYKTEKLTAVQDAEDKSVFTTTHTIPAQAKGTVSVDVMDRAGNDSAKADTDKMVVVDDITAVLDAQYTFTDGQYREYNDIYYTQGETKVTFTIDEANFDVASKPVVTVNEENREVTWNQTSGTDKWVGEITLTGNDDYAIKVTFADKSGNVMDTYEKTVHIDNVAPEFDVTYDNNEARNDNNYKADRAATVKITEHNFKADEVVLTIAAEDINGNPVDISAKAYADYAKNPANWNSVEDIHTLKTEGMKFDIEAIYSMKLEYTDLAENVGEVYETEFVVDKTDAGNIKIEYSTSVLDKVIEGITFGFYKAPVTITVMAEDETAGVEYFELTYEKKNGLPNQSYVSDVNTDTYKTEKLTAVQDAEDKSVFTTTHTIPAQARGTVSVDVMDRAGNDSAKADTDKMVVVDDITAVLDAQYTFTDGQYREYNDIYYTQGETKVTFTIDEANFDVASKPVVTVNEENREVTWNQTTGTDKWVGEITLTGNGDYAIKVTFADKSGNVMDTYEKTVHIDNVAPKFDVTYDNNEARNENNYKADRMATVKITEHNFKADEVVLTIAAEDINGNPVDISAKAYADYAKNPANWNTVGDVHTLNTDGMKFDIEAIYSVKLEYTDLAENEAKAYETDFVVDKTDAGNIKIEYSTSVLDEIIEGITFGFYKAPVTITVTAEDETAGVEYFELTYTKETGASDVNTDTYKTEKLIAVQDAEDKSVFTATHTIPAQARGSVSVDVMDRAGNDSAKADTDKMVVVDDITPVLDVQYTFTDGQYREYNDIYYTQGETKVTFTIDEANFDVASKPVVTVNEENREVTWNQTTGTDKWVGEITLTGNGDYAIKVTFADKSGNVMDTYEKTVHIDNEAPVFDVTYDNNEARNENNYKADRTATVKITEHNFKADEVVLTVTAEDINGNSVDIASKEYADYAKNPTNWNTTGDVHTLKTNGMKFDIEAIYSVKLEYTDLAENVAEVYETEFVVDKTDAGNIKIEYSTSVLDEIIEGITFGFYKAPVTVTVTAEDETAGVEYFELTYTKEAGASNVNTDTYKTEKLTAVQDAEDKSVFTATHTIPAQARGSVSVNVMDRAGNDSKKADTKMLVVDDISPTRKVEYANAVVLNRATMTPVDSYEEDDVVILYYETEAEVTITINEANFYKEDVKVSVTKNGVENVQDVTWTDESVDVHVGKFTLSGDGDYFVKVTYTDRSGNVMNDYVADEYKSQEIRIDNTDPTTSVEYSSDAEPVNVKYYKADRKAVITIVDHNFLADDVVATVTAKNVQNKDIANAEEIAKNFADYLRNRDSWTHSGDVHTAEITFAEDAQYTFKIDYKDIVGNSAVTYEAEPFVVDHKAPTDAITVEYKTPIIEKVISAITFGFYNPSVTVVITADDITSGVDYFEWTYNQEADTSTEKNVATESGKIGTGDISYLNEGKTATTNFVLSADEAKQYRGNITFTATDRAGNTCAEYQDTDDISIVDTISPTINVTYTAKEADAKVHYVDKNLDDINTVEEFKANGYQAYYDGNVVATIQINEANFFEGIKTDDNEVIHEVGILLVKTYDDGSEQKVEFLPEGSVQKYTGASAHGIEWKKDGDTYSYDIPYDEEADYELTVEYVDFSNNNASVSADDSNSFEDIKTYTSKIITVDKTAPIVAVAYGNKNIKNTVGGRQYFDAKQTATITVEEHNFRADDFNATIVARDVCEEDVTVEDFAKTLATRENWRKNGNTYTIEIEYPVDANYTFDYEYEDLAQNSAEEYKQDVFTVDTTAPKNLKVVYSTSVLEKILESITFSYYNAEMTVTISAEDETAGIHYFVYSYIKDSGVSDVNAELLNEVIKNANENIKQNGKVFTTEFKIPKLALGNDNQFNGTVKFTAYDRAENDTEKVDNHRIVVDNIKPTIAVTYNNPVQTVNNISYYAGNIEGTIVINEANFYSEDVKIVVTKDGSPIAVNVKWVDNSVDVHTGTFTLAEDGDYIVSIEYKDRSSNAMDTYTSNRLTLDTKAPTVNVTNIKHNSANKDEQYSFVITANDTNLNAESFKPVLTAVVRGEDGSYSTKTISLGDMTTVEAGKIYSYTINNLEEDAVYALACSLKDMSENAYSKIVLSDGNEYEEVRFSINRNGSTFAMNENTEKLVNQYYVYSVDEDVVIEEVNVDPIENYVVKLNGKALTEGTDYKTSLSDRAEEWSKRTYTISKSLFEEEGEYSIVVESTDKAETTAYSDVKNLNVSFVVDQTKPVVTISGLETSGRYQVEEQVVTIMPTDDGGRLNSVKVILMDSDGKELSILFEMSGEELLNYLIENDGKITFVVPEGLENKVQIICDDCAVNAAGDTNEYNEIFERVTVSQSTWVIYYANKPLFYGTIAGALTLIAGIIILIVLKKRKKEENN